MKKIIEIIKFFSLHSKGDDEEISLDNFYPLPEESKERVFAIDGGNAVVYDGGTWILQKLRVGITGYKENRIMEIKNAVETHAVYGWKNNNIEIKFDNIDKSFSEDFSRMKFEDIGDSIRKILELKTAVKFIDEMNKGDILLLDGTFGGDLKTEKSTIKELLEKCMEKGINVIGIAKTSRMKTKSGANFLGLVSKKADKKMWYYKVKNGEIIAKLNARGDVFRMNYSGDLKKILSALRFYSKDPMIPGYPYPLIRADRLARISEHERIQEKRRISVTAKNMGIDKIEADINTQNFHKKLDRRNFR